MKNLLASDQVGAIVPRDKVSGKQKKIAVSLHVDGVNTDNKLNIDSSVIPHQITGVCRQCQDTNFVTYEDALRIRDGIHEGEFHYAQEADVFAIGFNDATRTSLIAVAESPSCKKDMVNGESMDTIMSIVSKIIDTYHELDLHNTIGPLVTINSDSAAPFRKACGEKLSVDLPIEVREIFFL